MNFLALIEAKRDGHILSEEQIRTLVHDYADGTIPDYQMAAMLMAIFFCGLNRPETRALTLAMRDSGEVLKFPEDPRPLVDKHSTGGVGDKVSLVLAPLLACLGFRVPMISGRGLGITGGTLDKLESIPGFTTALTAERIVAQVQSIGVAVAGQTETMVPADKRLYALRDVTGTVPSVPLITASILSKKLAEGLHALVMDVKFGSAAFMQTKEQARELAESIVSLANECGISTCALLSDMSTPLGRGAGNWLEIKESVECLQGRGPDDLRELVIDCAASLLVQTEHAADLPQARTHAAAVLASGEPLSKWEQLLTAQDGDLEAYRRKLREDHSAPVVVELKAPQSGVVSRCEARIVGEVIRDLGGGRLTKESVLNHGVGIDALKKPGEAVNAGDVLCRVHATTMIGAEDALARVISAFEFSARP